MGRGGAGSPLTGLRRFHSPSQAWGATEGLSLRSSPKNPTPSPTGSWAQLCPHLPAP